MEKNLANYNNKLVRVKTQSGKEFKGVFRLLGENTFSINNYVIKDEVIEKIKYKKRISSKPYNDGTKTTKQKRHILTYVLQSDKIGYWTVCGLEVRDKLLFDIEYDDSNIDFYMKKALELYLISIDGAMVASKDYKIKLIKHFLGGEKL